MAVGFLNGAAGEAVESGVFAAGFYCNRPRGVAIHAGQELWRPSGGVSIVGSGRT